LHLVLVASSSIFFMVVLLLSFMLWVLITWSRISFVLISPRLTCGRLSACVAWLMPNHSLEFALDPWCMATFLFSSFSCARFHWLRGSSTSWCWWWSGVTAPAAGSVQLCYVYIDLFVQKVDPLRTQGRWPWACLCSRSSGITSRYGRCQLILSFIWDQPCGFPIDIFWLMLSDRLWLTILFSWAPSCVWFVMSSTSIFACFCTYMHCILLICIIHLH
jgi:hypothetical protein